MDVTRLLEGFLGSASGQQGQGQRQDQPGTPRSGGLPNGMLGGAAAGGLAALLLGTKKGRKLGGKALKIGGIAAVGGLAYKAYSDWQSNKTSGTEAQPLNLPAPPADSGFDVANDADATGQDFRLSLMQAMISAAKSDGHIDQAEQAHIHAQINALGLGPAEKAALFDSFGAPSDAAAVAALARTTEQRAEIYLASALSIDPDTPEERSYMESLAYALQLPQGLRGHLDLEAEAARRQAAEA